MRRNDPSPAVKAILEYCHDCFGTDGRMGRCGNRTCALYPTHRSSLVNLARAIQAECRFCWGAHPEECTTETCPLHGVRTLRPRRGRGEPQ